MDQNIATTLQGAIQSELLRRFESDDSAMAEYVVVMLQNGKEAADLTAELSDLITNYDESFTNWIFEQVRRLQAGQAVEFQSTNTNASSTEQDVDMDTEPADTASKQDDPGMGYPSSRLYSGLKKTLQENGGETQKSRHRTEHDGVRSTPYGTVAVGNGAMRIPTGPRSENQQSRQSGAGPIRSKDQRVDRQNGRQQKANGITDIPEMPQFPGFPMLPAQFFAGMPMMNGSNIPRTPTRRCSKWPTCFKGKTCTFGHPTTICQNPACRKSDGTCPNLHASEDIDLASGVELQNKTEEEQEAKSIARAQRLNNKSHFATSFGVKPIPPENDGSKPICKFGEACTNRSCHFSHPSPASKNGSSIVLSPEACKSGMDCTDENCSFSHPSPSNKYVPGVKLNTIAGEVQCKFHPCLNPSCRFQHTAGQQGSASTAPVSAFGGARNKVWTPASSTTVVGTNPPKTAERTFVSGEAEEQFTSGSNVHDNDSEMIK